MTSHQKRLSVPNSWPVERKTDTFTVKAGAGPHGEAGVPLLVLLRDVLGYVDDRKEARYALGQDGVLVNGEPVTDEARPIGMFDILGFPDRSEFYRVFPDEGGRLSLTAIDDDAADSRLGKVTGKRQVTGGATQLSLHDGTNVAVDDESAYATTDSIVVDVADKSVVAHFPFEEGALVTAIRGNHAGKVGRIESIEVTAGSGSNIVHVEADAGDFETVQEYVVVIDEAFTESTDDEPTAAEVDEGSTATPDPDETDESASEDEGSTATPDPDETDESASEDDDEAPDAATGGDDGAETDEGATDDDADGATDAGGDGEDGDATDEGAGANGGADE